MPTDHVDFEALLARWRSGDRTAADEIIAVTYQEMRRMARAFFRRERANHTLRPTALVHEVYLRLLRTRRIRATSREGFFQIVAFHMRRQLIDHARRRAASKRSSGSVRVNFDDVIDLIPSAGIASSEETLQHLDDALGRLEKDHPRVSNVVQLRYFAGSSNQQVAEALGVSTGTVKRELAFARVWLARELGSDG